MDYNDENAQKVLTKSVPYSILFLVILLILLEKYWEAEMEKRERVMKAIRGEYVDRIPSGFSLHFPPRVAKGEAAVQAHLNFFKETDTDIIKIMNENLVPVVSGVKEPEDFDKIPEISIKDKFMQNQIELTKKILANCDKNAFSLGTLHGIVASSVHPFEMGGMEYLKARKFVLNALRKNEKPVLKALDRITEGMCELAKMYIRLGVDGVYYAALGGEADLLTDEEHERWFKPYDLKIMRTIKESGGYCFLHICKDGLKMERYRDYGELSDVVNWGVYEAPFSLKEGRKLFPETCIMGGLKNRSGVLIEGNEKLIYQEVKHVVEEAGRKGFILGADCTLPTEIPYEHVRMAVHAARTL